MTEEVSYQTEQHLFTEEDVFQFEEATGTQRFLNLLIDSLLIRYALAYAAGFAIGSLLISISENLYLNVFFNENKTTTFLINYLLGAIIYVIYYTFCEKVFKGHTLGKLITGTKAVKETGEQLTFKDALLRSLCRVVPFEVFSGFAPAPWHDKWTKTTVIKAR